MDKSITARDPAQSNESPFGQIARGIGSATRQVGIFVFKALIIVLKALREVYWVLDRDSKVRAQGLQTVGQVVKTEEKENTGPEGDVYYTQHVTFQYKVGGRTRTVEKKVHRFDGVYRGDRIRVYYLPRTQGLDTAIDRDLKPLPENGLPGAGS